MTEEELQAEAAGEGMALENLHAPPEMGEPDAKVISTGGLARMITEISDTIDTYDAMLTLNGLRIIYERMKGTAECTAKQ